jgi:peptidoglycan/LPS O-acetylase OafA/YrhL
MERSDADRGRLGELDSLRGYAAFVVVLDHFVFVFGPRTLPSGQRQISTLFKILELSPLHLIIAGHEAVMLFFLLSGFVLSLPYWRHSNPPYGRFLVKRVFRLYVPYLVALLLACSANYFINGFTPAASDWFNHVWRLPPDRHSILQHIGMIGNYRFSQYNTAFWSLVYEARISLVFPLIVFLVSKITWRASLWTALLSSVAAQCIALKVHDQATIVTLHYAALFIIGASGAKYHASLSRWMAQIGTKKQRAMLIATFFVLSTAHLLAHVPGILHKLTYVTDWPSIAACAVLLLCALEYSAFRQHLLLAVPRYLGRISYSLYLVHATVLFAMVHLLLGKISNVLLFLAYILITLAVSSAFHFAIEAPAIALGRRFGQSPRKRPLAHHAESVTCETPSV